MKAGDFARARRMALLVRGLMALVAGLAFLVAGLAYDWYVCLTLGVLSLDASAPRLSAAARRGPAPGTGEAAPRPGRGGLLARLALPALLLILPPLAGWAAVNALRGPWGRWPAVLVAAATAALVVLAVHAVAAVLRHPRPMLGGAEPGAAADGEA